MKISVVIPVYNLEKYIGRALDSIQRQTSAPDEVIIVDDGSQDSTLEIVRSYPFRVEIQSNQGPGAARNHGVSVATGDWIAFLDGDDFWEPDRIFALRMAEASNPKAVLIACNDFEGPLEGPWKKRELHLHYKPDRPIFRQLYRGNFLATSSVAVKRDIFLEVGGMNPEYPSAQDFELWLWIVQMGSIEFIPKSLTRYVIRPGSISHNITKRLIFSLKIADQYRIRVGKRLYLYRVMLCYYEAASAYMKQGQVFLAGKVSVRMPFAILSRILRLGP